MFFPAAVKLLNRELYPLKILTRYIFRETFTYFLICVLVFTGLLLTGRILKLTNLIVNRGVDVSDIALVILSIIPTFLEICLPMATLLGLMLAFARLSGDSELIVLRASGVSVQSLRIPVLVFGSCIAVLTLFIALELRPVGYQQLRETFFAIAKKKTTAGLTPGVFNPLGSLTLYAEQIDHKSGLMKSVLIDDKRADDARQIIVAKGGKLTSNSEKQLLILSLEDGVIHEHKDGRYLLTDFTTNNLVLRSEELADPDAEQGSVRPRELRINELRQSSEDLSSYLKHSTAIQEGPKDNPIEDVEVPPHPNLPDEIAPFFTNSDFTLKKLDEKSRQFNVELQRRFSLSVAPLILALIAMPLGIQSPRMQKAWGPSLSIVIGFVVFVLYFGLSSIGSAIAEEGIVPIVVGLWLPNVIFLAVGIYFQRQMQSEKWQSVAEGVLGVFKK